MDALFTLYSDLRLDGRETDAWRSEHAPDGDLATLFAGAGAFVIASLAAKVTDHAAQLRAACECARRTSSLLPAFDPRGLETLALTQLALDDPQALHRVRRAYGSAYLAQIDASPAGFAAVSAVKAVYATASLATREPWFGRSDGKPADLANVVSYAENALCNGEDRAREDVSLELAAVLREHVPCPTLEALRRAFAEDPGR